MLKSSLRVLIVMAGLMSLGANASLVPTDWKAANDGKATLDTQTGIEWLDLSVTDGLTIGQVKSLLSTTYAGWRLPTQEEVLTMLSHAMTMFSYSQISSTVQLGTSGIPQSAEQFVNLFGETHKEANRRGAYGRYETATGRVPVAGVDIFYGANQRTITYTTIDASGDAPVYYGVYLVSDGGLTLSSINNPSLNASNPNAPINNPVVPEPEPELPQLPSDVPAQGAGMAVAMLMLASIFRRRKG
jgi:hypothetical protein